MADGLSLKDIDAQLVRAQSETELMQHQRDALIYGHGAAHVSRPPLRAGDPGAGMIWIDEVAKIDASSYQRLYEQMHQAYLSRPPAPMVMNKPLNEISNADLVMEMIKRGFAVMKLPDDGGPPEALRGNT